VSTLAARCATLVVVFATGCARLPLGDAPLTIATAWPADERARLEHAFAAWAAARLGAEDGPLRIDWVEVEPGDDLVRLVLPPGRPRDWRARPLDVVLGGPVSAYAELAQAGRLVAADGPDRPPWRIARRVPIGWASLPPRRGDRAASDDFALDDPRHAPLTLAWAQGVFRATGWPEGYAVERAEAGITPALPFRGDAGLVFLPGPSTAEWVEGVALVQGGDNPTLATLFLEFLATHDRARAADPRETPTPAADALLRDLLGATLVDAHGELVRAWRAWERAGRPVEHGRWLTEPPPWPPASVDRLLKAQGGAPLLDTLLEQITPNADTRAWLRRSWLTAERRVDGPLVAEIATAVDGRLAREPRFRAWLCGEWTAWARQRYRRVERQLERAVPDRAAEAP
jgi:hypothetical protein